MKGRKVMKRNNIELEIAWRDEHFGQTDVE